MILRAPTPPSEPPSERVANGHDRPEGLPLQPTRGFARSSLGTPAALVKTEDNPTRDHGTRGGLHGAPLGPDASRWRTGALTGCCPEGAPHDGGTTKTPAYVKACAAGAWHIKVWDGPGTTPRTVPWRCNAWRHAGECARRSAHLLYARIAEALGEIPDADLVYCVFTFAQSDDRLFRDAEHAYKEIGACLTRLVRDLRRAWPGEAVEYVATVEAHRSGWPHVNVVFHSPALADYVRGWIDDQRPDAWLAHLQHRAGFGEVAWWDGVDPEKGDIAGYVTKLAGLFLEGANAVTSEIVKLSQLPMDAPARMRRVRASRGFLPARRKKETFAAVLVSQRDDGCKWHEDHLRRRGLEIGPGFELRKLGEKTIAGADFEMKQPTWVGGDDYWEKECYWDDRTAVFASVLENGRIRRELKRVLGDGPPEPEWWER